MFRYLKTIGAHSGAPEPELMPVQTGSNIGKGNVCELADGYLANSCTKNKHKFLTLEPKIENDGKKFISCIRILPGMLLEADFYGDTSNIKEGVHLTVNTDDEIGYGYCVEGDSTFEVVDASNCSESYKVILTAVF